MSSTLLLSAGGATERIIRVDGCTTSSCARGTLKSFDADINSGEVIHGTIPQDITGIFFPRVFGNDILGEGIGPANSDIFYIEVDKVNSLVRITNTPGKLERVLFGF